MIDYFKSFLQLDLSALSGLKPETVLKSRVTRLATLINSIFFLISHYSYFIHVVKIIGLYLWKLINVPVLVL